MSTGIALFTGELGVADGVPAEVPFDTFGEMELMSSGTGFLAPDGVDGLYIVTFEVGWYGGPVPDPALRSVELLVNGTTAANAAASSNTYDVGTTIVRVLSGEKVTVLVGHTDSAAVGGVNYAKLSLARLAP